MNQEQTGLFISELKKENGLAQQQLADMLRVTKKHIQMGMRKRYAEIIKHRTSLCSASYKRKRTAVR